MLIIALLQNSVNKSILKIKICLPVSRNTACNNYGGSPFNKKSNDAMLLVLSADHVIQDVEAFHKAISIASNHAQEGKLTTFGIVPTNANTDMAI